MGDNKINMPSSTAGIMRYFDDYKSKIEITPGQVLILIVIVMIIIILLHNFAGNLIGL